MRCEAGHGAVIGNRTVSAGHRRPPDLTKGNGMHDPLTNHRRKSAVRGVAVCSGALLVAVTLPAAGAVAAPGGGGCEHRNNNSYDKLLGCVTLDGVREHQQALQD